MKRISLIGLTLILSLIFILPHADSTIPPTKAFTKIVTPSGNVSAVTSDTIIYFAGAGIIGNDNSKTITFQAINATGDNLGNHLATQNLNLQNNNVTNVNDLNAVTVTTGTNIVYRCATTGIGFFDVGVLTTNNASCLTSVDTGLRVN